jgi:hypothetical protein
MILNAPAFFKQYTTIPGRLVTNVKVCSLLRPAVTKREFVVGSQQYIASDFGVSGK